ncbi:MAG: NAD(P)-binding protein [Phycisphaerales bacterium]|nr:NAD(P)-binding protein [Phycisphaerales bacterium]
MISRRTFVRSGLAAASLGWLRAHGIAGPRGGLPAGQEFRALVGSRPLAEVARGGVLINVGGLPFLQGYVGESFDDQTIPFHVPENNFPGDSPPAPTETIDVAIVGGGISGLLMAYLLRRHRPVVFDYLPRFGGTSMGETWRGTAYSLGGAYFINPDPGSELEALYEELELGRACRLAAGEDPVELNGVIRDDFWNVENLPRDEQAAFTAYLDAVSHFANDAYPDIPLDPSADNGWILDLDRISFRQDVENRVGGPLPARLASAIQGYFASSFGAGWDEISAAGGWNFVAAEEYGRWVMPGGNAFVANRLWELLTRSPDPLGGSDTATRLLPGCKVVDVRKSPQADWQVTWQDRQGELRSLLARRVVMCCPKHVAKHVLHNLDTIDDAKRLAMDHVHTAAYLCVNVLVDGAVGHDFYDLFLLNTGLLPMSSQEFAQHPPIIDVINAQFSAVGRPANSVLTLYWPLPWSHARRSFLTGDDWTAYANLAAPQIHRVLEVLGIAAGRVRQVRMGRWGHAMPISEPGFIADGWPEQLRRPIEDRVFFVHQDNWVLPAFETCMLEALHFAPQVAAGLP